MQLPYSFMAVNGYCTVKCTWKIPCHELVLRGASCFKFLEMHQPMVYCLQLIEPPLWLDWRLVANVKCHELELRDCNIDDNAAIHLSKTSCAKLDLSNNKIGNIGAMHLANFKGHFLNLKSNRINDVSYFANCHLLHLNLKFNHQSCIGHKGNAILKHSKIYDLAIDDNRWIIPLAKRNYLCEFILEYFPKDIVTIIGHRLAK